MKYGTKKDDIKQEKSSTSLALIGIRGQWSGSKVDWVLPEKSPNTGSKVEISTTERRLLENKHKSKRLNMQRIIEVKRLMAMGFTQTQIIQKLRTKKGHGERQIKKDMAALSKAAVKY